MSVSNVITILFLITALFIFTRPDKLPYMDLQVNHDGQPSDIHRAVGGLCDNEKCLTVYVSPSCPTSPRITSMLISLVAELEKDNIKTNIIVGSDPTDKVNYFAKRYPFDVLLDPSGHFFRKANLEYTPTFIVTNNKGDIIRKQSTAYLSPVDMRKKLKI